MTGKEKCEMLREIRRQIAESNDIVYLSAECHHTGDCAGTCPLCDAEIRYLDDEINRKMENGERVTLSGLSVKEFESYLEKDKASGEPPYDDNSVKSSEDDLMVEGGFMDDFQIWA